MNIEDVRERLRKIEQAADKGDDEMAHVEQDRLWGEVLRAIAKGEATRPRQLATEALRADDIEFARWYA